MSAALVEEVLTGSTDNLTFKAINYFHGACAPGNFIITPDLFDTQISELAKACDAKIQHDIKEFEYANQLTSDSSAMIRPIYPPLFASGIFIDSFSPKTEKESASLIKALKAFAVDLVIVLDNKHLEFKISQQIKEINQNTGRETVVYFMQKPQGVTANSTDEYSLI